MIIAYVPSKYIRIIYLLGYLYIYWQKKTIQKRAIFYCFSRPEIVEFRKASFLLHIVRTKFYDARMGFLSVKNDEQIK